MKSFHIYDPFIKKHTNVIPKDSIKSPLPANENLLKKGAAVDRIGPDRQKKFPKSLFGFKSVSAT